MLKQSTFLGTLAGIGFLFATISGALAIEMPTAQMTESHSTQSLQFRRIEQPLVNKVAVTLGGLGLIGLEMWWFLLSKPKSQSLQVLVSILLMLS